MLDQTQELKQRIKVLKEQLQEGAKIIKSHKPSLGLIQQEIAEEYLSRIEGKRFNHRDFDMADRNGEQ